MSLKARTFADYEAALTFCYSEEISGEAYFARLAELHDGRARRGLELLAEIERVTEIAVRPLIERHGLKTLPPPELVAAGRAAADAQAEMPWPEFIASMADDYGAYVEEFEQARAMAPAEDRAGFDILIDHEIAAIEFARREVAGDPDSTAPLLAYLARHRSG